MSTDRQEMTVDGGDGTNEGGDPKPPVTTAAATEIPNLRLSLFPNNEHISDSYDDPQLEFSSGVLRSLEKYLPLEMLTSNRDEKAKFMSNILRKYISRKECNRAKKKKKHRQKIASKYQPRYKGLYELHPNLYLLPSFRDAVNEKTEESFRRIISEPFPGVFVFQMFEPEFVESLLEEIEKFRKWAKETKTKIRKPNTMSKYGVVLDDFGLDIMLNQLIENYIFPVCKVFFPDVCGAMFDSHHGFVVEYGKDSDTELGLHVDDSEITVNVCLGKQFEGGELYFRGTRCEKHVDIDPKPEETFDYCRIPGQAILHRGRHRHGTTAITSGRRSNMVLWCRNSLYREMQTYQKEFSDWCGQCAHEKKENESQILAAKRKELIRIER